MDKELLIALIYKDLQELEVLTKGFSEMSFFPQTLVDLSVAKAKNIVDCLQKLPLSVTKSTEFVKIEEKNIAKIEEIAEEKPIEKVQKKVENLEENASEKVKILEEKPKIEIKIEEKVEAKIEAKIEKETATEPPQLPKEENIVAKSILKNKNLDLKQAFSIADRFRFQRELFGGNGEKFSQSLSDFNSMQSLEDAHNYIVKKLNLDLQNVAVQDFIEILKRKLS
jgi:hypothetical protein